MSSQTPDVEVLSPETAQTAQPSSASEADIVSAGSRCQYRYQNATRCRLQAADSESGLCVRHLRQKFAAILPSFPDDSADLSAELLPELSEFDSATPINKYLERLLVLATKGRVTPRRAAVLAYLTNQLLQSVHAMDREDAAEPQGFIFDLPRPKRD